MMNDITLLNALDIHVYVYTVYKIIIYTCIIIYGTCFSSSIFLDSSIGLEER